MRALERHLPQHMFTIIAYVYYYLLPPLNPVPYYRSFRRNMDARQRDHKIKQIRQQLPVATETTSGSGTGPLFTHIPTEIRHQILIHAFGGRTIHLDLDFEHLESGIGELRWSSCVCHSSKPGLPHKLRYEDNFFKPQGRIRTAEKRNPLDCPGILNESLSQPCPSSDEFNVGASGWLLSCRQAYAEGIEVLYHTNTIHIDSEILLKGIQDILPPEKLDLISSLEITMNSHDAYMDSFTGVCRDATPNSPFIPFPSLLQLHIMNPGNAHGAYFIVPYCVDRLLERAVLPTTVVTASNNTWRNFSNFDLHLLESQGQEKTQMKWADIGGLVCWREIPVDEKVATTEDASARRGYWWHVPEDLVDFSDHDHIELYTRT
ncbi:unnamed protein product [Clonostachys rosea f. rosea IK726]|uniref:Uncharacterized protein n=1 Tax=Clonostachys rosea f. rosea IK726 TaxID=1349383 RepID=A0ACA9TJ62_BIOOC|nr:unnamed protein product [Clonostachys rosea f. rosea IK726]